MWEKRSSQIIGWSLYFWLEIEVQDYCTFTCTDTTNWVSQSEHIYISSRTNIDMAVARDSSRHVFIVLMVSWTSLVDSSFFKNCWETHILPNPVELPMIIGWLSIILCEYFFHEKPRFIWNLTCFFSTGNLLHVLLHPKSYGGGLHGPMEDMLLWQSGWWPSFEEHGQRLYSDSRRSKSFYEDVGQYWHKTCEQNYNYQT